MRTVGLLGGNGSKKSDVEKETPPTEPNRSPLGAFFGRLLLLLLLPLLITPLRLIVLISRTRWRATKICDLARRWQPYRRRGLGRSPKTKKKTNAAKKNKND